MQLVLSVVKQVRWYDILRLQTTDEHLGCFTSVFFQYHTQEVLWLERESTFVLIFLKRWC